MARRWLVGHVAEVTAGAGRGHVPVGRGATGAWRPPAWTAAGPSGDPQRTEDLTTIVQEIVRRPGGASGAALVLSGTGTRTADPVEGDAPPVLHLVYQRQNG